MCDFSFKKAFLILLVIGLQGCSGPKQTFDCPYGKGVGCRSISEVNQAVNEGQLPDTLKHSHSTVTFKENTVSKSAHFTDDMTIERVREQHLRVWLAPFQDAEGNFHEDSIIHTVLQPGFWQVN
jgi:conjugal transfer pilus assembly protein TraV